MLLNGSKSVLRSVFGVLLCSCLVFGSAGSHAAEVSVPAPTELEQIELAKYVVFDQPIEIIQSNSPQTIAFLDSHVGQTVFFDSFIYRYEQLPEDALAKGSDHYPPTDRFDNAIVKKCWGDDLNKKGVIESGEDGFPLPVDETDVNGGCANRIKLVLDEGDFSPNITKVAGFDKLQIFFAGFFKITKEQLENGKTLFTLTQQELSQETTKAFFKHKIRTHHDLRPLGIKKDVTQPPE